MPSVNWRERAIEYYEARMEEQKRLEKTHRHEHAEKLRRHLSRLLGKDVPENVIVLPEPGDCSFYVKAIVDGSTFTMPYHEDIFMEGRCAGCGETDRQHVRDLADVGAVLSGFLADHYCEKHAPDCDPPRPEEASMQTPEARLVAALRELMSGVNGDPANRGKARRP